MEGRGTGFQGFGAAPPVEVGKSRSATGCAAYEPWVNRQDWCGRGQAAYLMKRSQPA